MQERIIESIEVKTPLFSLLVDTGGAVMDLLVLTVVMVFVLIALKQDKNKSTSKDGLE